MSSSQMLSHLRSIGLRLEVENDRLLVSPTTLITAALRALIAANKAALIALVADSRMPVAPPSTNDPELPVVFVARRDRLIRWGYGEEEAERTAARLTVRDDEEDDRRMCFECSWLSDKGRCLAATRMTNASDRLEPVPDILQRCSSFGLKKGLS